MNKICTIVNSLCFIPGSLPIGPVEFEEEKISLASVTGPLSDISDRSGNSFGGHITEQQKKAEGDGISLQSGTGSLQSGGGPLVSISGSASATGVLPSTSPSPSSVVTSNVVGLLDSTANLGGSSSDMKGKDIHITLKPTNRDSTVKGVCILWGGRGVKQF